MRLSSVFLLVLVLSVDGQPARTQSRCVYDEVGSSGKTVSLNCSSFRGISLASTPGEVAKVVRGLGYETDTYTYIGSNDVSGVSIYLDHQQIGSVNFGRNGQAIRLSLKDYFFCAKPPFVRHFAEEVFEHYDVKATRERDDVCYQDVTCFKGTSRYSERFLILRMGVSAELFARPSPDAIPCHKMATVN